MEYEAQVVKKLSDKQRLKIIEGLCLLWSNNRKLAGMYLDDIYKVSHLASNCTVRHMEWGEQAFKIAEVLIKLNVFSREEFEGLKEEL